MTTLHLGDCLNGCETCYDNYHSGFKNIECDQCGKFIEGAPICNNCGQYEIHENDFDCPAYESTLCENCGEETAENHATNNFWNWICLECWNTEKEKI